MRADLSILKMGWHTLRLNVQNSLSFFALIFMMQFIGVKELAGFTTLIRLGAFLVYPATAIGRAAATLAGHAIGKGDFELANRWAVNAGLLVSMVCAILGTPFWLFARHLLVWVTGSQVVAATAELPMRILGVTIIFSGWGVLLTALLAGTGGANRARRINFLSQWVFLMPAAILAGPVLGLGLLGVWVAQSASRMLLALLLWREWGRWRAKAFAMREG